MIDYNGKKQTLCILMHLKQTLHNRQLHETKLQYEGRVLMFNHIPYISIYVDQSFQNHISHFLSVKFNYVCIELSQRQLEF